MIKRYQSKTIARKTKIRAKLRRLAHRPRLSVFRSLKYIYAQIIDDDKGKTLVAVSEKDLGKKTNQENRLKKAMALGEILAQKAKKKKIKSVYFDRGAYKYHGRIKALAEGARKGGLEF